MHIMGHRGAPAYEPENTLRSIRRALAMGVTRWRSMSSLPKTASWL